MVKGEEDNTYKKLASRLRCLHAVSNNAFYKTKTAGKVEKKTIPTKTKVFHLKEPAAHYNTSKNHSIVDLIFEQGLDKAMEQYDVKNSKLEKWDIEKIFTPEELLEMDTVFENMMPGTSNNNGKNEL